MIRACFWLALTLFAFAAFAQPGPSVAVTRIREPIKLDGRLDEPVWQEATVLTLTQQSSRPREATPFGAEVLYCSARTESTSGFSDGPGAWEDRNPQHATRVSIALDRYHDERTGYFFQINAAGARTDGLISTPESPSYEWDGVWDARTARLENGWSAEIMIPTRTLSFTPGLDKCGLNLERFVPREGRVVLRCWSSPTHDSLLCDMSRAGEVSGSGELEQGLGIEFSPFAVGRMKTGFAQSPLAWQGTGGFDFTWKITPQLLTVFTANTDFAETEVDSRQINITRFPLFFPEKRSFFLEGANQYVFGLGLGSAFIPFFSRQVGLWNRQPTTLSRLSPPSPRPPPTAP